MGDISDVKKDRDTPFIRGITWQREIYKQSMMQKDFVLAITAIENIKVEIKNRAISKGLKPKIEYIEERIEWFRTIPFRYSVRTPTGSTISLPQNIELKVIKKFNNAYEKIIVILNNLKMI